MAWSIDVVDDVFVPSADVEGVGVGVIGQASLSSPVQGRW